MIGVAPIYAPTCGRPGLSENLKGCLQSPDGCHLIARLKRIVCPGEVANLGQALKGIKLNLPNKK